MKITIESKGEFDKTMGWLAKMVNQAPVAELRAVAAAGEASLARGTPKDTGETASGWVSEITTYSGNSVIEWSNIAHPGAGVNVAKIIEQGHGTGTGGYVPPNPYIVSSMKPVWDESVEVMVKELLK